MVLTEIVLKIHCREFPTGIVDRILGFHFKVPGSNPGHGTEILQASRQSQKIKKKIFLRLLYKLRGSFLDVDWLWRYWVVLSQPEVTDIAEDPFLRPRTDFTLNNYCLVQQTGSCQSVIPRIVRNGVGRKKNGHQGPFPVRGKKQTQSSRNRRSWCQN